MKRAITEAAAAAPSSFGAPALLPAAPVLPRRQRVRTRAPGGPEAVADKAREYLSQVAGLVLVPGASTRAIADAVATQVASLQCKCPPPEVAARLAATGAKAKPVLRVLYALVGQAGKAEEGFPTSAALFQALGFLGVELHQNRVTKEDAATMLLQVCAQLPAVAARALANARD